MAAGHVTRGSRISGRQGGSEGGRNLCRRRQSLSSQLTVITLKLPLLSPPCSSPPALRAGFGARRTAAARGRPGPGKGPRRAHRHLPGGPSLSAAAAPGERGGARPPPGAQPTPARAAVLVSAAPALPLPRPALSHPVALHSCRIRVNTCCVPVTSWAAGTLSEKTRRTVPSWTARAGGGETLETPTRT